MVKKVFVDVEKSLQFASNGRLKPADKKDIAHTKVKNFVCPNCGNKLEVGSIQFGEDVICPKCKDVMQIQY